MWIGTDHYATIEDWVEEAHVQGVSKRIPNPGIGEALIEDGSVVFVAHDEGEKHECPECIGSIECPACRKADRDIDNASKEKASRLEEATELLDLDRKLTHNEAKRLRKLHRRAHTLEGHVAIAQDAKDGCSECFGAGEIEDVGTGGYITIDDQRIDYRRVNYALHHEGFELVAADSVHMCEHCGGTGQLPDGRVFGLFVPDAVEYVLKPTDSATIKAEAAARSFRPVSMRAVEGEPSRGCGRRHPGYYVVTEGAAGDDSRAREVVADLIAKDVIDPNDVEVKGSFVRFLAPVDIAGTKRFRGIKRWNLAPAAEAEAEMIFDAVNQ
jgi:hypothetical protein